MCTAWDSTLSLPRGRSFGAGVLPRLFGGAPVGFMWGDDVASVKYIHLLSLLFQRPLEVGYRHQELGMSQHISPGTETPARQNHDLFFIFTRTYSMYYS